MRSRVPQDNPITATTSSSSGINASSSSGGGCELWFMDRRAFRVIMARHKRKRLNMKLMLLEKVRVSLFCQESCVDERGGEKAGEGGALTPSNELKTPFFSTALDFPIYYYCLIHPSIHSLIIHSVFVFIYIGENPQQDTWRDTPTTRNPFHCHGGEISRIPSRTSHC